MSYDIRLGVKVAGAPDDCYAEIMSPRYDSPTYNLGKMFRACTGWDYKQGKWYKVSEVLPLIEHGVHELRFNSKEYQKYTPENGWGSLGGALETLESMLECIRRNTGDDEMWSVNDIPIDCLYIKW